MDSWGDFKCKLECSVWWLYYLRHSSSWNNMALLSQYPKCFQKLLFNLIFQHPTQTPSRLDHLSLQNSLPSCFCFSSLLHFWHCSGGLTKCTIAAKSPKSPDWPTLPKVAQIIHSYTFLMHLKRKEAASGPHKVDPVKWRPFEAWCLCLCLCIWIWKGKGSACGLHKVDAPVKWRHFEAWWAGISSFTGWCEDPCRVSPEHHPHPPHHHHHLCQANGMKGKVAFKTS